MGGIHSTVTSLYESLCGISSRNPAGSASEDEEEALIEDGLRAFHDVESGLGSDSDEERFQNGDAVLTGTEERLQALLSDLRKDEEDVERTLNMAEAEATYQGKPQDKGSENSGEESFPMQRSPNKRSSLT